MDVKEIREILESPYNRNTWKSFIQTQFTNNQLAKDDYTLQLGKSELYTECFSLGHYAVDDYTKIGIFEVQLTKGVNLTRNRVGLRNLIKDLTSQVAGAMVVFVQGDKWRFSYISKRKVKNKETNTIEDKETAPKRYTYLFGKGEKALTAAQNFAKLIDKQRGNIFQLLSLDDFEDAFSVERLSKEFFDQYKKSYDDFVEFLTGKRYKKSGNRYTEQYIKEPDLQLTALFGGKDEKAEKAARDFCKRMMGRIVFLYFIQKKGWLAVPRNKEWGEGQSNYMYVLFKNSPNKDNFYSSELVPLFFKTLNNPNSESELNEFRYPYLNGGLFDDTQDKQYNKLFLPSNIFNDLFETFNNFNFTVYEDAPEEHTLAVDPEMLGHIFENLLEDNKDKGAFYTPKEIVHFMCQESIKTYLLASEELGFYKFDLSNSTIHKIIRQIELNEHEKDFAEKNAYKIIDALDNLKICDPAIGSGAFPMGLLQEIFNAQIYLQELKGFKKGVSDADIKKHIIQETIYGIDIDSGAVDIARLRFWLSLVVDEIRPHPLPNLDYKIITGNSLVSRFNIDESIDLVFKTLNEDRKKRGLMEVNISDYKTLMNRYLNTSDKEAKIAFKNLIDEIKNAFITTLTTKHKTTLSLARGEYENLLGVDLLGQKKGTASEILKAKEKLDKVERELNEIKDGIIYKDSIEWRFQFPGILNNNGDFEGFDIVIGNPPYIKEYTNKDAFDGFRKSKYYQGKMDLWYGFACVLIDKLKPNGVQCFIAQNNWTTSAGASKLRDKILSDTKIKSFIDFGNYKVFASAGIQTMIYLVQKTKVKSGEAYPIKYSLLINENLPEENLIEFLDFDFKTDYAQKYLFDITPLSNNEKAFTFNTNLDEVILNEIASKANYQFSDKEVAQGIVPNPDVVNSRNIVKIPEEIIEQYGIKAGDGVFIVKKGTFDKLNENEKKYIKPIFEPNEVSRYKFVNEYETEIIYITKANYKDDAPNLVKHLEKYRAIMDERRENQNGRLEFFHLHWPRDEHYFSEGPKILSVRKCSKPTFIYTEKPAFVMMSFNIIRTHSKNHKYLTALLNSRLIEYWLRNKGKMQGNNFQIDKEPIVNIPLVIPEDVTQFEILVDYLIFLNNRLQVAVNPYADNSSIAPVFEDVVNMMVYELYFKQHMQELEIDVLQFIDTENHFKPIDTSDNADKKANAKIIGDCYNELQKQDNPIRNRILLSNIKSPDIIKRINASTN